MKISTKGEYACFAVLDLSLLYPQQEPVESETIAKRQDIPLKYLEQILAELKRKGIVESRRGQKGGYLLAKPPAHISLLDVIQSVEGSIFSLKCINGSPHQQCRKETDCSFKSIWNGIAAQIQQVLKDVNFEEISSKIKNGRGKMYYI